MLGRLFNSLSCRLRHELRVWRKTNQTVKETAWPWYQKVLIDVGKYPVGFPVGLLVVVLLLSAVSWSCYYTLCESTLCSLSVLPTISEHHFPSLWTTQAAIAAMIYPVVIGFMSLLLQRRHSGKASLQIYLHNSAAIVTGLSALFLVATMSIQFFFIEMIEKPVLAVWLALDGAWFLVNILGVIWFLYRTFDFLRTDKRTNIVRTYAINHVWPVEIRCNLEHHRFYEAVYRGWLPGPNSIDAESDSYTAILIHFSGCDRGDAQVTDQSKDKYYIRDVRFRPLSMAIRSWKQREESLVQSQDQQPSTFVDLYYSRLFILPSAPGEQFNATFGLARTAGGEGLTRCEKWLVRQSFVLRRKKQLKSPLSISEILSDLVADTLVAMETNEEVAFREALDELADLHCSLIQAGNFVTSNGGRDNYAALEDCNDIFGRRMHALWTLEYQRLLKKAIERLSVNNTYFSYLAYLPSQLMSELGMVRPTIIVSDFLGLSRYLHEHLKRWWSRTVEAQGLLNHGPCEPAILHAPDFALYESAIKEFLGAWEILKNKHFPPKRDEAMAWDQLGAISKLYTKHLDGTILMLFENLFLGNKVGAEWLCDSLIKWCDIPRNKLTEHCEYYINDERKLTLELMQKPWEEAKKVIDLFMPGVDESNAPRSLWAACIKNYWIDLCCLSLYVMIQQGEECECERSLPAFLAGNLGKGTPLHEGGNTISGQWPIQGPEDLLIAIVRQLYFDDGGYQQGYRARFDQMVERISYLSQPTMVTGRVYSNMRPGDMDTLLDGQLVLLCLLIKEDWMPSAGFMETIQKWGSENFDDMQAFVMQLEQWQTRLNDPDFQRYKSFFSCTQVKFDAVDKLEDAIAALSAGIEQLISNINSFQNEPLKNTQVSENRLKEVAKWGSRSGFCKESGSVPVSLFREVLRSGESYDEHSLSIQNLNKGGFIEPRMAQQVDNEEECFERIVRSKVAASVMAKILNSVSPKVIHVDSPVTYWERIQSAASRIREADGTPVLLVAGRANPQWLLDWVRSYYDEDAVRPEGLQWVQDKRLESEGYVGSLNKIPVYVAPIGIGSSYVISQEMLDVLRVTEFENDVFVRASTEQVQGDDMLINLKLTWRFQLELRAGECWQLSYTQ